MSDYTTNYKRRVLVAEEEARRFLQRVEVMRAAMKKLDSYIPPAENAAMKRASLDLTRALAAVRKGLWHDG
jgi:hypothetical protein